MSRLDYKGTCKMVSGLSFVTELIESTLFRNLENFIFSILPQRSRDFVPKSVWSTPFSENKNSK